MHCRLWLGLRQTSHITGSGSRQTTVQPGTEVLDFRYDGIPLQ